ncbi:hypothetical protein XH93_20155 [Bradyrhizobium sp. CCBAU 51753]|nr:hypothetical protein XH93_20155 [Bradyrhizobium sp. CCBAU 51753]
MHIADLNIGGETGLVSIEVEKGTTLLPLGGQHPRIKYTDEAGYVILIDKKYEYEKGRSRIVYIGTTKNGFSRVAQSAAAWADDIFALRGVREFEVRIITCQPRRNLMTWRILERALLLQFREQYGEIPAANTQGKNISERGEFRVFSRNRIQRVLEDLT